MRCLLDRLYACAKQFKHYAFTQATPVSSRVAFTGKQRRNASVQITLPLLDALLTDEKFVRRAEEQI